MVRRFFLTMTLLFFASTLAIVPPSYSYEECCEEVDNECCNRWGNGFLIGGAALVAALAGGIAGAVSKGKGSRGCAGIKGATGAAPIFTRDPDPNQTLRFDVSLKIDVAGPSPKITLTPFVTDPEGKTTQAATVNVTVSGIYTTPAITLSNLINGIYVWGIIIQATGAEGTFIDIPSDDSQWMVTPSRSGETEFGLPSIVEGISYTSNDIVSVEIPAATAYDFEFFINGE